MAHTIFCEYLKKAATEMKDVAVQVCGCRLRQDDIAPVPGAGYPQADIVFVKALASDDEAAAGMAFHGGTGAALLSICLALGVEPSFVYATNSIKCPRRESHLEVCSAHCAAYLKQELHITAPRLVVLFGEPAAAALDLEYAPGDMVRLAPGQDALMTHDLESVLKDKSAKQEVWRHLKAITSV